jgi:hypothetical protein
MGCIICDSNINGKSYAFAIPDIVSNILIDDSLREPVRQLGHPVLT